MLFRFMQSAGIGTTFAVVLFATPALAAATHYKLEVVSAQSAGLQKTDVTVRLLHVPDNKPVSNAVIFETHADMGPEGMPTMPGDVKAGTPQSGGA